MTLGHGGMMTTEATPGHSARTNAQLGVRCRERCAVLLATLLQYAKYPATQTQLGGFHLFCRTTF